MLYPKSILQKRFYFKKKEEYFLQKQIINLEIKLKLLLPNIIIKYIKLKQIDVNLINFRYLLYIESTVNNIYGIIDAQLF